MRVEASQAVADFAAAARGFCQWCEGQGGELTDVSAASWLARLYGLAVVLPSVTCDYENDLPDVPVDALARAQAQLSTFAGRYYRKVFDPDPELDDAPVMGDLGDDLLDVYLDIRQGLMLFESGETRDALWHWSFLHRIHWGRHCVGALQGLHGLTVSNLR